MIPRKEDADVGVPTKDGVAGLIGMVEKSVGIETSWADRSEGGDNRQFLTRETGAHSPRRLAPGLKGFLF